MLCYRSLFVLSFKKLQRGFKSFRWCFGDGEGSVVEGGSDLFKAL